MLLSPNPFVGWKQHTLPQLWILQHIICSKLLRIDTMHAQHLDRGAREPALRHLRRALHEEHNWSRIDRVIDRLARLLWEQPARRERKEDLVGRLLGDGAEGSRGRRGEGAEGLEVLLVYLMFEYGMGGSVPSRKLSGRTWWLGECCCAARREVVHTEGAFTKEASASVMMATYRDFFRLRW